MKFTSIIAIVSALAMTTMALPVSSKSGESVDIQSKADAVKSAANDMVSTMESDAEEIVDSTIDSAIESSFIPFYITAPSKTDIFNSNDVVKTSWYNGIEGPFLINVIQGPEPLDMQPTGIFLHADGESGSYDWHIPENLPSGLYGFKYIYKLKGVRSESYSDPFKVIKSEKIQKPASMNANDQKSHETSKITTATAQDNDSTKEQQA